MKIKCICVDDEALARQGIQILLNKYKDFEWVASYCDVEDTLREAPENIDVIFLDIEMPNQNGFTLLEQWPGALPIVVFITAYNQYAIQAFEQQALDYILKPISEKRFDQVISRIRDNVNQHKKARSTEQLKLTISHLQTKLFKQDKEICLKTDEGYFQIKLRDLLYIEAAGDHVCFHFINKQLITRNTLRSYAEQLIDDQFYQINKSLLVNAQHVKQVIKRRFGDYNIILSNDLSLKLTRHYKSVVQYII